MDFTSVKEFLDKLTATRVPGNAISVYHKNREVFRYSSGYSDLEGKTPMTGDELLNIYSCSKPVTVTAALQLYERGMFLLDDPIYDFIPEYREMYIKTIDGELKRAENPITMRHLFTMTAGLTYNLQSDGIDEARKITDGKMDTITVAKCLAKDPLSFESGEHYQYSLCHDVLAAVVEIISGQRFRDYIKNNIFAPLGVDNIYYNRTDEVKARMATHYSYTSPEDFDPDKKAQFNEIAKDPAFVFGSEYDCGGAGIAIAVPDYAKFTNAMAQFGKCPNGERLLSRGTIDLMRQNQFDRQKLTELDNGICKRFKGYGYGLGVRTMMDKAKGGALSSVGEFGWDGAAGALCHIDPEMELGFFYGQHVLSTNADMDYTIPKLRDMICRCIED